MRCVRHAAVMALTTLILPACSILERSDKATNVEDEPRAQAEQSAPPTPAAPSQQLTTTATPVSDIDWDNQDHPKQTDTAPAPQKIQGAEKATTPDPNAPNPRIQEAHDVFAKALKEQYDAAFVQASQLWAYYIDHFTGMPGYERALYNQALCSYHLGRPAESVEPLKGLIHGTADQSLAYEARLLLAESLLHTGDYDQALSLTFEALPDQKAEEQVGLKRQYGAIGVEGSPTEPGLTQKIRLYTLRGRIFASLGNEMAADNALHKARLLLDGPAKHKLSQTVRIKLDAAWAWRQIEVTALICRIKHPTPERLSEAEFLAYADAYYGCATPARSLYCKVLAAKDEQIRSQALITYRGLVEAPLDIKNHLPPPAREIRKQAQRGPYEREMKTLIEKTVLERSREYKNLDSCRAYDVF